MTLKINIIFLAMLLPALTFAQKTAILYESQEIEQAIKAELDASMAGGALKQFALDNKMTGEYIIDITVDHAGKVLTVFAVSNDTDDLKRQTMLLDFLRQTKFNFKLVKGKRHKYQYAFQFGE